MATITPRGNFKKLTAAELDALCAGQPGARRRARVWVWDCPGSSQGRGNRKHSARLDDQGYPAAFCQRGCGRDAVLEGIGYPRYETPYTPRGGVSQRRPRGAWTPRRPKPPEHRTRAPRAPQGDEAARQRARLERHRELIRRARPAEGVAPVHAWLERYGADVERSLPMLKWLDAAAINASWVFGKPNPRAPHTNGAGAIVHSLTDGWNPRRASQHGAPLVGTCMVFIHADGAKARPDKRTLNLVDGGAARGMFVLDGSCQALVVVEGLKDALIARRALGYRTVALIGVPKAGHFDTLERLAWQSGRVLLYPEGDAGAADRKAWRALGERLDARAQDILHGGERVSDWGDMGHIVDWTQTLAERRRVWAPCGHCPGDGADCLPADACPTCEGRVCLVHTDGRALREHQAMLDHTEFCVPCEERKRRRDIVRANEAA